MTKKIILCADDFGQDPHISRAILELAKDRRISAISCMTTGEDWHHHGPELKALENQVDRGLHFNLTHGDGSYFRPLNYWLLRSMTRQIDKTFIEKRLNEQLDQFIHSVGKPPDFIDGHQHIHTFPMIRDVLIKVIKARYQNSMPYVRAIHPVLHGGGSKLKVLVSQAISFRFSQALDSHGIRHNPTFGGMYSLQGNEHYRHFMIRWFQQAIPGTLLMCHPGVTPKRPTNDPHPAARVQEYNYFSSQVFPEDCLKAGIILGRFSHHTR